jgi:hypothetical protein
MPAAGNIVNPSCDLAIAPGDRQIRMRRCGRRANWSQGRLQGEEPMGDDDLDQMGPVDYLVVEFQESRLTGEGLPLLVNLVDRGIIRILDLVFIRKRLDGSVEAVAISDVDHDGTLDLAVFEGASSGLVAGNDLLEAAGALEPGKLAAILVYENRWAAPLAVAMRRGGGQLVASGRIPVQALLAALDEAEARTADAAN